MPVVLTFAPTDAQTLDAHIICEKRAIHFNPTSNLGGSDTASVVSGGAAPTLQQYKDAWLPMHAAQAGVMYWMVCCLSFRGEWDC